MADESDDPRDVAARRAKSLVHRARPLVTVGRIFGGAVVAALVAACIVIIAAVTSGDWQLQPILSGSMRPGLPVGGVVAVQRVPASSLRVRDVVLFHPPGQPNDTYVHRIISMTKTPHGYAIKTQGDANRYPDPWTVQFKGRWAYEAKFTVPLVGYAAVWDHSPTGLRDLLLAGGSLIVLGAGSVILGELKRLRRKKSGTGDSDVTVEEDPAPGTDATAQDGAAGPFRPRRVPLDRVSRRSERTLRRDPAVAREENAERRASMTRVANRR